MKYFAVILCYISCFTLFAAQYRAIWVDTWNNGILSRSQIDTLVDTARENNVNTIIVEIRKVADAYYASNLEPRASNIQESDLDPLGYLLEKAHDTSNGKNKIEIHGWLVMNRMWKGSISSAPADHIINTHPEWLSKNAAGESVEGTNYFIEMGVPGAVDHMVSVVEDLVTNYDIDGVNLDYIRYPESEGPWGYNDLSIARFQKLYSKTGTPSESDSDWLDYKRNNVTQLVRQIYIAINKIKPQVMLSADTIAWGGVSSDFANSSAYSGVFQDWKGWMENHYLDINIPMIYKRESTSSQASDYRNWITFGINNRNERHFLAGMGSYLNTVDDAITQVQYAESQAAQGSSIYCYSTSNNESVSTTDFLSQLKTEVFTQWEDVPTSSWKENPQTGYISGKVYNPDNDALEQVAITLSGTSYETRSEICGFYGLWEVAPGNYNLRFTSTEYGTAEIAVTVEAGQVTSQDYHYQSTLGRFSGPEKLSYAKAAKIQLEDSNCTDQSISLSVVNTDTSGTFSLTVTQTQPGQYSGTLSISESGDAQSIAALDNQTIQITYADQDNGNGISEDVIFTLRTDCRAPIISNALMTSSKPTSMEYSLEIDESGEVKLFQSVKGKNAFTIVTTLNSDSGTLQNTLHNLYPFTEYQYYFTVEDEWGNIRTDDISGQYHEVKTTQNISFVNETLDTLPSWQMESAWEFGTPQGFSNSSYTEPAAGYTGNNVFANNLNGDYEVIDPMNYLTTPEIDIANSDITLEFMRWLSVERAYSNTTPWDVARVEVWNNHTDAWTVLWQNALDASLVDTQWTLCSYELSSYLTGADKMKIRWGIQSDNWVFYGGWNLDDITLFSRYTETPYSVDFDYEITENNIPSFLAPGQSFTLELKIKNTGNGIWFNDGVFRLLPLENIDHFQIQSPIIISTTTSPGEEITLPILLQCPQTPGIYPLKIQMDKTISGLFGSATTLNIRVTETMAENYMSFK